MNVLLWFRRDLRSSDHPALSHAAALGPVLPVFIADPAAWARGGVSSRHWAFAADCLTDLRDALGGQGLPLAIRRGPAAEVLASLCKAYAITHIVTHESHDPWQRAQDAGLRDWAATRGITWHGIDPAADVPAPDSLVPVAEVAGGVLPDARALGLPDLPCAQRQAGGRSRGLALAQGFAAKKLAGYHAALRRGDPCHDPRLAAHLAWGTLCRADLARALEAAPDTASAADRKAFLALADLPPAAPLPDMAPCDSPVFTAWAKGQSGWPFVDAAMRALRQTGHLPAPVLRHLIAVACGPFGLPAGAVFLHLARLATAFDPVRLAADLAAAQLPRDPHRMAAAADPEGRFIRQWLPELAGLPEGFLHRPWQWLGAAQSYPAPVVSPEAPRKPRAPLRPRAGLRAPLPPPDQRQSAFDFR